MSIALVKLTDKHNRTHGDTAWEVGHRLSIPTEKRCTLLCSRGLFHAYRSVEQALLLNPAHGRYPDDGPVWAAEAPEVVADDGTKVGVHELTITGPLDRPAWFTDAELRRRIQVRFAVLCARAVLAIYEERRPGDERPRKAIEAAEAYLAGKRLSVRVMRAAAYAAYAAYDAAYAADYAADYAAYAADAVAYAATAAYAAADAVAYAATAADAAADAADAARRASRSGSLDTVALAREAVEVETGARS